MAAVTLAFVAIENALDLAEENAVLDALRAKYKAKNLKIMRATNNRKPDAKFKIIRNGEQRRLHRVREEMQS